MGKNVRKIVDANRDEKDEEKKKELQLDDKGISSLTDIDNNLSTLSHLTRLILAHNRLTKITQGKLHIVYHFKRLEWGASYQWSSLIYSASRRIRTK